MTLSKCIARDCGKQFDTDTPETRANLRSFWMRYCPECRTKGNAGTPAIVEIPAFVEITRTKRTHYVYGSGEHGCLYDNCGATETFQDAVDSLAETFELGRTRKSRLLANRYLELRPADGAAYCEISECSCLRPWDHSEIDEPENWPDYPQPISCDQCQMLSINGIACHETGCPNMGARWDSESGEWIKQRKCFTCGYTVDADDECCNGEEN